VVTRSPHKFKDVKPMTTVVEAQLDEEEKLKGDFCLDCVASSEWDKLAPHVSSGPQAKKNPAVI